MSMGPCCLCACAHSLFLHRTCRSGEANSATLQPSCGNWLFLVETKSTLVRQPLSVFPCGQIWTVQLDLKRSPPPSELGHATYQNDTSLFGIRAMRWIQPSNEQGKAARATGCSCSGLAIIWANKLSRALSNLKWVSIWLFLEAS